MPPSIPQGSLSAITRCRTSASSTSSLPIRNFTTTVQRSAIGPENPKFIEIPQPPQQQAPERRNVKGALPIPRNVFRKKKINKTSDEYLNSATPRPIDQKPTTNEWISYKRRLADIRRQNLHEGLRELEKRKINQDHQLAATSKHKSLLRERRLNAPQREDERLTNPTTRAANNLGKFGVLEDPNRAARVAAKTARVQARQQELEEARRDALHTLYMNARSFIITEEQLEAKVEEIFTRHPHAKDNTEQNIWKHGHPPTVEQMLNAVGNTNARTIDYGSGPTATTVKRYRKIAEQLTGGKMDG